MSHLARGSAWTRWWALFGAAGCLVAASLVAAENNPLPATAEQLVKQALHSEAQGGADRAQLLEQARQLDPNYAPAQWHSGKVRYQEKWTAAAHIPDLAKSDALLAEYLKVRDTYADTAAGQFDLANWCARKGLPAAERVHLLRTVELNPDHAMAHARLGDRRINDHWLTEEQYRDEQSRLAALKQWIPRLNEIRQGLAQADGSQRAAAEARLKAIADPTAVPALETLADESEEVGQRFVAALGQIEGPQAALALARLAAYSPYTGVQGDAIDELRTRPLESFVPPMLAALSSPIVAKGELIGPKGRPVFRQTFQRETQDANNVVVRESPAKKTHISRRLRGPNRLPPQEVYEPTKAGAETIQALLDQNAEIHDVNDRVISVLASITGRSVTSDPQDWWIWWQEQSGLYSGSEKPMIVSHEKGKQEYNVTRYVSCFAAGTKVETLLGPVPIEKIKIGDQVLSQDPETGELAYKPVLLTTTRAPSPLFTLEVGGEKIRATGGHLFWVAGIGWIKARDLKPGYELHGPTGAVQLTAVTGAASEPAHNLVVDDFHSYFVGDSRVLAHDNTLRQPTQAIVPGLAAK